MTATDEKVVRPAAKPGIKVRRTNSVVDRRRAKKPATATPNIFTKKSPISSPFETVKKRNREPRAPPNPIASKRFNSLVIKPC